MVRKRTVKQTIEQFNIITVSELLDEYIKEL